MKNLKENIHKNNMKKLMLSVVLGMFCYCTNNAMKNPIKIDKVLDSMLSRQYILLQFKANIKDLKGKIYSTIKEQNKKVTKKNVLDFIQKQISTKNKTEKDLKDNIKILEQYFHLDEIQKEDEECNEGNLTEIFWTATEAEGEMKDQIKEENEKKIIEDYFEGIIDAEKQISEDFKDYYNAKKEENKEAQYEEILKEIMKDCCGEEKQGNIVTNFLENLRKKEFTGINKDDKELILKTIKRRITLSNTTEEEEKDFISFLKQKIVEEKKDSPKNDKPAEEEEKKNSTKSGKPAEEEWCSCCNDCCGKE